MPARKIKIRKPQPVEETKPTCLAPEMFCMFCNTKLPPFHETVVCKAPACRQKQAQLQQLRRDHRWNGEIEPGFIFQCTSAAIF